MRTFFWQINNSFLEYMQQLITSLQEAMETGGDAPTTYIIPGPIKKPERALQKLVRLYDRNPACLTDIVRCTIVAAGIREAAGFLRMLMDRSVVGMSNAYADESERDGLEDDQTRTMRITQVKNR